MVVLAALMEDAGREDAHDRLQHLDLGYKFPRIPWFIVTHTHSASFVQLFPVRGIEHAMVLVRFLLVLLKAALAPLLLSSFAGITPR
ncbi:hypothetical protein EJB05_15913, partial [Eragrostis curvula]